MFVLLLGIEVALGCPPSHNGQVSALGDDDVPCLQVNTYSSSVSIELINECDAEVRVYDTCEFEWQWEGESCEPLLIGTNCATGGDAYPCPLDIDINVEDLGVGGGSAVLSMRRQADRM
jgi:hypothetical protein